MLEDIIDAQVTQDETTYDNDNDKTNDVDLEKLQDAGFQLNFARVKDVEIPLFRLEQKV